MTKVESTGSGPTPGDLAFGMPVMELCNHPEYLTDDTEYYGGNDQDKPGYLGTHWPSFITVDLLKKQTIGAICFKLWDWEDPFNRDPKKGENQEMRYAYRLLVSRDRKNWLLLFDPATPSLPESEKFRKGWQCFSFPPREIRYIRIHCLRNRKNSGFHIVKLKAFADADADFFKSLIRDVPCIECKGVIPQEDGDGTPLSFRLVNLAGQIQEIRTFCVKRISALRELRAPNGIESEDSFLSSILDTIDGKREPGKSLIGRLFKRGHEVQQVAASIDETRSLIAEPVRREGEKDGENQKIGFLADYLFGIFQFAIVSVMYFASDRNISGCICLIGMILAILIFCFKFFRWNGKEVFGKKEKENHFPCILTIHDSEGNQLERCRDGHLWAVDNWGNIHGFSKDGNQETIWMSKARLAGKAPGRTEGDKHDVPFATIEYPQEDGARNNVRETLRDSLGNENVFNLFEIECRGSKTKPVYFDTDGAQRKAILASIPCGRKMDGSVIPMDKGKYVRLMGLRDLSLPCFSSNGSLERSAIFYNEKIGFHSVPTPGWIEFDFGQEEETRYLRFLLWDNAGAGKRQRSHRVYNYRVLYRSMLDSPWKVLHDTMGFGSCGWQEFIKEDGPPWRIRYIRIYGISNSGTIGNGTLQLIRLGISRESATADLQYSIRNRIVKYDGTKATENGIPDLMQIVVWLRQREKAGTRENDWQQACNDLIKSYGMSVPAGQSSNMALRNLFGTVFEFAERLVNEKYSIDSTEDFARDVQSLISETLKPVQSVKREQERFEQCMRWPKTILVAVAALPIVADCLEKSSELGLLLWLAIVTLCVGSILIYAIWKPGRIWHFLKQCFSTPLTIRTKLQE